MKRLYTSVIALLLVCGLAQSQERYIDEVFADVTVLPDQIYGVNITILFFPDILPDTLNFDLYMPAGDTCDSRPLAVVLHTGSFFPRGVLNAVGDKDDYANVQVCERLAKRGYVAASIEYRKGWNPLSLQDTIRRAGIIQAAYRAVQDVHTFIRFMNMTYVEQGNPFGIDTSRVAIFGIGTGGFVGFNAAVIEDVQEIFIDKFTNPVSGRHYIDTLLLGNITGTQPGVLNVPNWAGYRSNFHFTFGLDGAVGDTSWMEDVGDIPMVCVGTVSHPTTPFGIDPVTNMINCDLPVFVQGTGLFVVNIAGSACMIDKANTLGQNDVLNDATFDDPISETLRQETLAQEHLWAIHLPGFQAGPWEYWDSTFWKLVPSPSPDCPNVHACGLLTNPDMSMDKANRYLDTSLWFFSPRAFVALDLANDECSPSSLESIEAFEVGFTMMPNPANNKLHLSSAADAHMQAVYLYNTLGQPVKSKTAIESVNHDLDVSNLPAGYYFVRVEFDKGFVADRLVIQH